MLTAGAERENTDCFFQEGCYSGKQNGRAGRENADCWLMKAVTKESRMHVQEERMLTDGAGRENADCWCRKGEC